MPPLIKTTALGMSEFVPVKCCILFGLSRESQRLDPPRLRPPNVLVNLQLQTHGKPILQNPSGEVDRGHLVVRRRKQRRVWFPFQSASDNFASPLVVSPAGDYEFEFVVCL